MPTLIDSVLALVLVTASLLLFVAGFRLLSAASPFDRIQAVVKAGAAGLALFLLAIALAAGDLAIFLRAGVAGIVLLLGAALSGQVLGHLVERDAQGDKS